MGTEGVVAALDVGVVCLGGTASAELAVAVAALDLLVRGVGKLCPTG